jgi:integrase
MRHNPLHVVAGPKICYKEVKVFSEKELSTLITSAKGQLKHMIQLVAFSGLRASEMIALRWSDINFKTKTIKVSKRIREGIEDIPKSKRTRIVDMLPQAIQALKAQYKLTHDKEYVFLNRLNTPYKRANNITASIKQLCEKANISIGTLQTLRRTCNTLYKQYNLPNDWILDQLGHMQDDVNRNHYTGRLKPNLSKIGKVLSK